jgi:hypothetical protein
MEKIMIKEKEKMRDIYLDAGINLTLLDGKRPTVAACLATSVSLIGFRYSAISLTIIISVCSPESLAIASCIVDAAFLHSLYISVSIMVSEMAEYLKPMRLTEVARVTGVSYPTLQKIAINDPNSKFRKSSLKVVSDAVFLIILSYQTHPLGSYSNGTHHLALIPMALE